MLRNYGLAEAVKAATKETGILPAMKLKRESDWLAYAAALHEEGIRVLEITMTTPGVIGAIEAISDAYGERLFVAAGTVLDPSSALEVIRHGGSLIVNPCVIPDVIDVAHRYQVPVYSGAFSPTEVFSAMRAGSAMVKIFPARLGGPGYMTNLKMVFPGVDLVPSGGITIDTAGDYIKAGACAVSGARAFIGPLDGEAGNTESVATHIRKLLSVISAAKEARAELP